MPLVIVESANIPIGRAFDATLADGDHRLFVRIKRLNQRTMLIEPDDLRDVVSTVIENNVTSFGIGPSCMPVGDSVRHAQLSKASQLLQQLRAIGSGRFRGNHLSIGCGYGTLSYILRHEKRGAEESMAGEVLQGASSQLGVTKMSDRKHGRCRIAVVIAAIVLLHTPVIADAHQTTRRPITQPISNSCKCNCWCVADRMFSSAHPVYWAKIYYETCLCDLLQ